MTSHGFIPDNKADIDEYKKNHWREWSFILGDIKSEDDFDVIEEAPVEEDFNNIMNEFLD